MKEETKLYIDQMWAIFVGRLSDNIMHRHYALQISLSAQADMRVTDEHGEQHTHQRFLVNSNIPHQLQADGLHLTILVNPLSSVGHQLFKKYGGMPIVASDDDFTQLARYFSAYVANELTFLGLAKYIGTYMKELGCAGEAQNHVADDRIYNAIQYLEKHVERIVSLEEIADYCHLSPTRFLHLFKEKTAINFRRYQLWNKLIKSIPYLNVHSITESAHQFGFTDSSHYTRTFRETFGVSPKMLKGIK